MEITGVAHPQFCASFVATEVCCLKKTGTRMAPADKLNQTSMVGM
jgi:hypothetical protein